MEKLDGFLPPEEILYGIRRQLVNAGVREEDIPTNWIPAIAAAFSKVISTKEEGYNYISNLLNFHWQKGKIDKQYTILNEIGQPAKDVKPGSVYIFTGILVDGEKIHPQQLLIEDLPIFKCDGCGIRSHCVKEVVNWKRDSLESLCNMCLMYSDDIKQKQEADMGLCEGCSDLMCIHNPRNTGAP